MPLPWPWVLGGRKYAKGGNDAMKFARLWGYYSTEYTYRVNEHNEAWVSPPF